MCFSCICLFCTCLFLSFFSCDHLAWGRGVCPYASHAFVCFARVCFCPFSLVITSLGEEEFVHVFLGHLFVLHVFVFVLFLL